LAFERPKVAIIACGSGVSSRDRGQLRCWISFSGAIAPGSQKLAGERAKKVPFKGTFLRFLPAVLG